MEDRINFYRSPGERTLLRSLTGRSDARGLLQVVPLLIIYILTTGASVSFFLRGQWIAMGIAAYGHALFTSFLGMEATVHELSHKTPFRTRWLNEFFYGLFCLLTWNNPVHFRESHRRHHQYTMHVGRDKEVVMEPAPWKWFNYIQWFTFDWMWFRTIMGANLRFVFGRDLPDIFAWDPLFETDDPRRARMFLWARLQMLLHLALVAVFAVSGLYILIFTVSFSYFFATAAGRSTGISQHVGMQSNIPDWRMSCHTFLYGPLMSFLYWNMNYHIEHHAYAAVPFFNLGKLHRAIADDCPPPVRGYWKGLSRILGIMRRPRTDPEYCFIPELPEGAAPFRME